MPGWSLAADGATMIAELTGPRAPRSLWQVPLLGPGRPIALPGMPDRPDPGVLPVPVRLHQALQAHGARSELLLLPGEGHTIVGRVRLVELSGWVAAWFDRWL